MGKENETLSLIKDLGGVQTIRVGDTTLAHIYRSELLEKSTGINFLTPNEYPIQVGVLDHPEGHKIRDHAHNPDIHYEIDKTQELLFVMEGKMLVKLFTQQLEDEPLWEVTLEKGDAILLVGGGHGFEMLESTKLLEVKQGPYYVENSSLHLKVYREDVNS